MGRRMKRMSQAADGTLILGASIGTLAAAGSSHSMGSICLCHLLMQEHSSGRDLR
jgi:hypothetical protein